MVKQNSEEKKNVEKNEGKKSNPTNNTIFYIRRNVNNP